MLPDKFYGLATGIGSLPHTCPGQAVDLMASCFKQIPHWPQLPRRGSAEGLVSQYLHILLRKNMLTLDEQKAVFCTDHPHWEQRLMELYQLLLEGASNSEGEEFALPASSAAGFFEFERRVPEMPNDVLCLKGQICGPVTVGFQVTDPQKRPSFYNQTLREIINHVLAGQAAWQVRRLKRLGFPALLFIDDPAIYGYGSSASVGLGQQEIQDSLKIIIDRIRSEGGFTGAHCCAGIDWSLLLELDLDILNFDAYDYFSSMLVYTRELDSFLGQGGVLAWGIVPTSEAAWQEDSSSLYDRLQQGMETLAGRGVDEHRLSRQFIITPSCGTGTLTVGLAERIYRLTAELAEKLR
ncbi:MAG TPA: hypothetical protein GX693_01300 [Firmicutes bacterium]|nr:hypothetical protein [Bacillota bacterium]